MHGSIIINKNLLEKSFLGQNPNFFAYVYILYNKSKVESGKVESEKLKDGMMEKIIKS